MKRQKIVIRQNPPEMFLIFKENKNFLIYRIKKPLKMVLDISRPRPFFMQKSSFIEPNEPRREQNLSLQVQFLGMIGRKKSNFIHYAMVGKSEKVNKRNINKILFEKKRKK